MVDGPATVEIPESTAEPAKRGPGRPPGSKSTKKPANGLTAKHVEEGMTVLFGLVAMVKGPGYEHWAVKGPEMAAWSGNAATLLGKIPVSVAEKAIDASAAVSVAVGLGTMVQRRTQEDKRVNALKAPQRPQNVPKPAPRPTPPEAAPKAAEGQPGAAQPTPPAAPIRLNGILA